MSSIQQKADFAFVLHALSYLSSKGRAAIVCFPGIFYRGGAEQKIRQYMIEKDFTLTDEHIARIMEVFDIKAEVEHFAKCVDYDVITKNDYTLSVSSYVEAKDTREVTDITQLSAELKA